MQPIKNDEPKRTVGGTMESITKTKKKVARSIINNTAAIISFVLIFVAIVVLTTDINFSSAFEVVELGLTLFILILCSYSMYINLADSGTRTAKKEETYIQTEKKHTDTKNIIKEKKMRPRATEFCVYWSREELKNTRCQFLDEVGIEYDEYEKLYVGKNEEELVGYELSEAQLVAIISANKVQAIKITPDDFLKRGRGGTGRRKPLGTKPETKKRIAFIVKFITTVLTSILTGVISLQLLVDPSWATFAECCLKILPIILSGFAGYKMGFENILVDTVNYMSDQIDLMEEFIQYVNLHPTPVKYSEETSEAKAEVKDVKLEDVKEEEKTIPPPFNNDSLEEVIV